MAALAVKTETFKWVEGADSISSYTAAVRDEPPPYRTAFCKHCGSPMPIVDPERPYVVIQAGCLDDDPGTRPFRHIFVGVKASWYEIHDGLPQYEGRLPPDQRLPYKRQ